MNKMIQPGSIDGELDAPASKSYAQRAIAAALLAQGTSELRYMDLCDDTSAALDVVARMGAKIKNDGRTYTIQGGLNPIHQDLNIGESGLSTRLFTPLAALCERPLTITGHGSMLKRPVAEMEKVLRELGVSITSDKGFLPIQVQGPVRGGEVTMNGASGSQFLTGLLMSLPLAKDDSIIYVKNLTSRPYIDMTIEVAEAFGIEIDHNDYECFFVKGNQTYTPTSYGVEGDWSGASCLLVAGALAGDITVNNLNPNSLQADKAIIRALVRAGATVGSNGNSYRVIKSDLNGFEFDATDCPDLFPALVALAANCEGKTILTGTNRLTHKESDRAQTLADVFGRLGIDVDISQENTMIVTGGTVRGGKVSSHNDHRIAMAAATVALTASERVEIEGAEAVSKSYPHFWNAFQSL